MLKLKALEKHVFASILKRYYFETSNPKIHRDLGTSASNLQNYLYAPDPIPNKAILHLNKLVPKLIETKKDRVKRKIQKLHEYLEVIENQGISDQNQLNAIILQKRKGKKIKPEIEEFDLKFKTNPKNQL